MRFITNAELVSSEHPHKHTSTSAGLWGTYNLLGVTLHDMAEKHWVGTFAAHNARKDLRVADVNSAVSNFKHAVAHEHLHPTVRRT